MKKRLTQCQQLLGTRACISCHPVNKATKGPGAVRLLLAGKAAQQSVKMVRCNCRAELQTPGERERERRERTSSVLILPFVKQHVENDLHCELFAELDSVLFHSLAET